MIPPMVSNARAGWHSESHALTIQSHCGGSVTITPRNCFGSTPDANNMVRRSCAAESVNTERLGSLKCGRASFHLAALAQFDGEADPVCGPKDQVQEGTLSPTTIADEVLDDRGSGIESALCSS